MKNCLTCTYCPSGLEDIKLSLIEDLGLRCSANKLVRYKRPSNAEDQEYGFLSYCKKYKGS